MPEKTVEASGRFRDTGLLVLFSSAWLIGMMLVLRLLFQKELAAMDMALQYLVTAGIEFVMLLPAAAYMMVKRIPFRSLFHQAQASQVVTGAFLGFLIVPVSIALSLMMATFVTLTGGSMLEEGVTNPVTLVQFLAALAALGIAAPLTEEVEFRALVLGGQSGAVHRLLAIFLTGLVFTMQHGQFAGFPSILLGGLVLTFLAWHSGSVWPSIAAHCTYNTSILLFQTLGTHLDGKLSLAWAFAIPPVSPAGPVPDLELGVGMAATSLVWAFIAMPFAVAAAAVMWGYWHSTRGARWPSPAKPSGLGFGKTWPWFAAVFILFAYVALDVLQVYGIIDIMAQ